MLQREQFSLNISIVVIHNTSLLVNYYNKKQHTYYINIINENFTMEQNRDTRYIYPPLIASLADIFTNECNCKIDIRVNTHSIQTHNEVAYIY